MTTLGLSSKREITRTSIRVRTAMAAQTRSRAATSAAGRRTGTGSLMPDRTRTRRTPRGAAGRTGWSPIRRPARGGVDVRAAAGRAHRGADRPRAERRRDPVPVGGRPGAEPAPDRGGMDAAHRGRDPGQPALHRPAGVEPAADRQRAGRPRERGAGAPAGAAVEPARRAGSSPPGPRIRRWSARPISSPPRPSAAPARGPDGPERRAGTCWPGC